jgi:hypothetical protein
MLEEGTVLFGILAGLGPGRVARNHLELCVQFVGNENLSSPLGPTPVDRRPKTCEGCKMRWASSRSGGYAVNPFLPHYHRG